MTFTSEEPSPCSLPDHREREKVSELSRLLRWTALLLILVSAFLIRLHDISAESLWSDEVLTHHIASKPLGQLFYDVAKFEQIPPVHHVIVHFWMKAFGDSEASVRFPSLLAGVASVWVIYLLGMRLLGTTAALTAALLLAVSPFQIVYAHESRSYTLMVLVGLLSTLAFVKLIERPTRRREVAYVLLSALLLYVHLFGGFVLAAHQVTFLIYFWRSRRILPLPSGAGRGEEAREGEAGSETTHFDTVKHPDPNPLPGGEGTRARAAEAEPLTFTRWVTISFAIAFLFAPYVPTVLNWFKSVGINFWVKKASWDDISYAFSVYSGSLPLYLMSIALVVLGVRSIWRRCEPTWRVFVVTLLLALLLLPVIVPVIYSIVRTPVFSPRYGIVASTALFLLIGAGISALPPPPLRVLLVALFVGLNLVAKPVDPWKADWRSAGKYLAERMQPGDVAIVHIKASTRQYDYYVRRLRPDTTRIGFDAGAAPLTLPLDPGRKVWFVIYGVHGPRTPQDVIDRGRWQILSTKWFPDGIAILEMDDRDPANLSTNAASEAPGD